MDLTRHHEQLTNLAPERDFTALGQICAQLHRPLRIVAAAVTQANVPIAMRLGGIPYFDATAVEAIVDRVRAHYDGSNPLSLMKDAQIQFPPTLPWQR